MASHWQAERVVDEVLAAALVRAQFPALAAESVELVAAGWDYTVHRVDGVWAFRFPRREVVLEPMRRELRVLPRLPAAVRAPRPELIGVPSASYPWPFWGARWLPGREAGAASDGERRVLAPELGDLLRRLHGTDVGGLPVDVVRRADMTHRVPLARAELAAVADLWEAPPAVAGLLSRAERLPPPERTATCHGDLHFRQLLVDGPLLTGVVDWVEVCRSDPGIDLQLAFAFLPEDARGAFFAAYGEPSEASLVRARVLALFLSAVLARFGRDQGLAEVEREAVASLGRATAGL